MSLPTRPQERRGAGGASPRTPPRDRREGTSSPWTRPRGRPWAMSSRTWSRRGGDEGVAAAAKEETTGRCRWSSPPRTSPRGRPRGAASLMRPSAQGGGEVGAQRCERGRGLREPDCVDACAGCHRSSRRGVRGSAARLRCGRGHEMASGVIVSTDKSARTAAGDVATDKGQGGRACSPAPTRPRDCRGDRWGSLPPQKSPRERPWGRLPW